MSAGLGLGGMEDSAAILDEDAMLGAMHDRLDQEGLEVDGDAAACSPRALASSLTISANVPREPRLGLQNTG